MKNLFNGIDENDLERIFRNVKISLKELKIVLYALEDSRAFYKRNGLEEATEEHTDIINKLKDKIIKD